MSPEVTRFLDLLDHPTDPEDVAREASKILPTLWRDPEAFDAVWSKVRVHTLVGKLLEPVQPLAQAYAQAVMLERRNQQLAAQAERDRASALSAPQKNGASRVPAPEAPGPKGAEANGMDVPAEPTA